jgi:hypothetical protein
VNPDRADGSEKLGFVHTVQVYDNIPILQINSIFTLLILERMNRTEKIITFVDKKSSQGKRILMDKTP